MSETKIHLRVRAERIGEARIHPFQYGQFIEYLADLVPGMWAELLDDGGFEGAIPYNVQFRKEADPRDRPWYPVGAVNRGEYLADEDHPFNGSASLRIRTEGEPATLGIAQDGIAVKEGERLRLSAYLRGEGLKVRARLYDGSTVLAEAAFRPGERWERFAADLTPFRSARRATLVFDFRGPGTLWIDRASLMPEKSVFGWRPDVVEALRKLKPGIIRFGGCTVETFDWRRLIGDPDRRPSWSNDPWGGRHPAAAGLEEIVALCRAVGAEPMLCVRVTGSTPEEAAAQVEYFNGEAETPMGRLRARNGRVAPWSVRYWQVGNELGGDEYAKRLGEFCAAMRRADPTIVLLSSYPSEAVLREASIYLQYVCPHHYECADLDGMSADFESVKALLVRCAPERDIKIGVTEWNTTAGDWGLARAMLWTLENALACSRYHFLLHRRADQAEIAIRSNLTNSFCSGIIQTSPDGFYVTPTYHAQALLSNRAGVWPLGIETDGTLGEYDASATLSEAEDCLALFVINGETEPREADIDLSDLAPVGTEAAISTLLDTERAGEREVANSPFEPDRVRVVKDSLRLDDSRIRIRLPELSLTLVEVPLERKR